MAHGQITHIEFPADDLDRARRFYGAVAGWEFSEMEGVPGYWLFQTGNGTGGAIGTRGESTGTVVRNFIEVASIADGLEAATRHGGTILEGRTEVPGQGFYAVLLDSEGSEIALWENPA
jgi:predicted enzyme related to lactoylglutathione lyase